MTSADTLTNFPNVLKFSFQTYLQEKIVPLFERTTKLSQEMIKYLVNLAKNCITQKVLMVLSRAENGYICTYCIHS